jgi:hypothetical protein
LLRFRTREASDPFFVLDDEREEQSWDELRECDEATVGSLRSSLEVFCRDIPKILQVIIPGVPFFVTKASFMTLGFPPQDLTDRSAAKSSFIRREVDVWGSLRSLRSSLAGATARLSQQGAEVADLRLLCADLEAEAAAARVEAQRRQSELEQSQVRIAEAESQAGALATDLAAARAASLEQRVRAGGMPLLF